MKTTAAFLALTFATFVAACGPLGRGERPAPTAVVTPAHLATAVDDATVPANPEGAVDATVACCQDVDGVLVCRDDACPELADAKECNTLSNTTPHVCQTPLTNYCVPTLLERTTHTTYHESFQTVYCFGNLAERDVELTTTWTIE